MTEYHSLQNNVVQEETQHNDVMVEEDDIAEAVPNIIHVNRKPSLNSFPQHKRIHNQGDSESEEDVTEEHVDTNLLANNLGIVQLDNNLNIATTDEALLQAPTPKSSTSTTSARSNSYISNHSHQQEQEPEIAAVQEHEQEDQPQEQIVSTDQQQEEQELSGEQQEGTQIIMEQQEEVEADTEQHLEGEMNTELQEEQEEEEEESIQTEEQQIDDNSNAGTLPENHEQEEEEANEHPTELIAPTSTTALVTETPLPQATTPLPPSTTAATNTNNTNRGRSISSVSPSTMTGGLLPRSQRVWEMDRQAPECRRCHRRFNFLVRRHHCRRCGQIVCDKCSSNRVRLPVEELIEDPIVSTSQYPLLASQSQRVCDTCFREPIRRSSESGSSSGAGGRSSRGYRSGRPVQYNGQMRRTDSNQSLMIDCPVCGTTFLGMPKQEQEEHLQRCLNVGSPPVQSPRYIVYELPKDSTQIGEECPICFDEFDQGDKISRMICLCSYHQRCLAGWLQRGKGCPVHYDSLLHQG